ncbi:MAG: hypothetical protein O2856_07755 [Planctomycetota bacterium]|nr:hypothetical protein [Planctomycetota bacterium]
MSASSSKDMRRVFAEWPVSIPKAGLIVTTFGESIPFCSFMLSGELLLIERKTPDAQGARRVIVSFDVINAVKILDAIEMPRFIAMGFQGGV